MENYFSFYQIEEKFLVDENVVRAKFLQLSKEFHPDLHAKSIASEKAMEITSQNNKGYKVMSNFHHRVQHLLRVKEILTDTNNVIPNKFLMEMMELNESIMELKMEMDEAALSMLKMEVEALKKQMDKDLVNAAEKADVLGVNHTDWKVEAVCVKDIYLKQKYVLRLRQSLNTFAP